MKQVICIKQQAARIIARTAELLNSQGHEIASSDAYFEARPLDCRVMPVTTKENEYA